MTSADDNAAVKKESLLASSWSDAGKKDWALANPWLWLAAGACFTLWAGLWTLTFRETASDGRVLVLAIGLLLAAIGVWLRWNDRETLYILPRSKRLAHGIRLAMAGAFGLLALALTIFFVATWFQDDRFAYKPGAMFLVWISLAPVSLFAARRCLKREPKQPLLDADGEVGLSFLAAAVIAFAGSAMLYLGEAYAEDWDTVRLFLRVLAVVCVLAAALVLASIGVRRLVLSLLLVLHFSAVATAALSAPPSPWLIQQTWVRLFRPYLEFTYLNNGYRFYSPEPSPASYIWYRLIYTSPEGQEYGWWYKTPQLDDKGRIAHPIGLEYQRHLALAEVVGAGDPAPPPLITNPRDPQGPPIENPFFVNRIRLDPRPQPLILGLPEVRNQLRIPLFPDVVPLQQISIPSERSKRLYASYARFVAHKFAAHPENPSWTFKSAKIYRVIHMIIQSQELSAGMSPTDPVLYRPFYVGSFLADGTEIDLDDPYRHWLLPILRDSMNDPDSGIKDYTRLHAGDPLWYRPPGMKHWSELAVPGGGK